MTTKKSPAQRSWVYWLVSGFALAAVTLSSGLAAEEVETSARYNFVCADFAKGEVLVVDQSGKVKQRYQALNPNDVWALPNGEVLFAWRKGVKIYNRDGENVFDWKASLPNEEIHTCQPLDNGNLLIAQNAASKIIEVTRQGKTVKEIVVKSQNNNVHMRFRMCRKLKNGNYLCMISCDNEIREIDSAGKLVRSIKNLKGIQMQKPHAVMRLENGNTLFSTGAGVTAVEVDPNDRVVWKLEPADVPEIKMGFMTGMNRLPNGNTVICFYQGSHHVIEVTRDKKLVWKYRLPGQKTLVSIQVLDQKGSAAQGEILK
ncbi:MAG: hypothetical protein VX438_09790 [Planctomycetota bacterium]|nr:hypothetical protein [Planctomycetota bacterium]